MSHSSFSHRISAIFSIYDDHEFVNNFAGEGDESKPPFANASTAFSTYYGNANPDPHQSDVSFYDFRYGDNAFFVLDTRRYRSVPNVDSESPIPPTMLGEKQLFALHSWLGKVNATATFKFIVSSVPFTSLWHGFDGQLDSWAAYKFERDSLLDVLQFVPNVVLLSGDRHEFAFIEHRGKIPEISGEHERFHVNDKTY
jgi:alkaline phosphatase D